MNKLGSVVGKSAFWITWPGLWLMLRWSHRTRLLLVCGDEFLVLCSWLGSGVWGLPGGGLHRNESPVVGLLREVKEEISEKPAVIAQPREIAEIQWQSLKNPILPLNSETQALREWWLNRT